MSWWRRYFSRRLGLALGGGGARGALHIGVLKALEAEGLAVQAVAGTSIGAVVGALYALTLDADLVEQRLLAYLESDIFKKTRFSQVGEIYSSSKLPFWNRLASFVKKEVLLTLALSRPCLISSEEFRQNIGFFFDDALRVEDTLVPFAAVATDLETGEPVVIRHGPLIEALYASCTYPGVVEPARLEGRLLVDGGLTAIVPVKAARDLRAGVVVAVNAGPHIQGAIGDVCALDTMLRAEDILLTELARCKTKDADILIHPETEHVGWYDFEQSPLFIPLGEKAAQQKIPEIKAALRPWSPPNPFKAMGLAFKRLGG